MTQTLHHSPHEQLAELLAASAGRFGRKLPTWFDPALTPSRTATVIRMRARLSSGEYRIDPFLVANAIVDRVCAGELMTTLH